MAPAAHFFMGGIVADEWGEVGLPGLLACGEVVGGVHGANRLGGSALPEMSVFGKRAGMRAAEYAASQRDFREPSGSQVGDIRTRLEKIRQREEGVQPIYMRNRIQALMWDNVLALRDENTLTDAIEQLEAIRADQLPRLALSSHTHTYNLEWMMALEAECMVDVAEMIARAALARQESRGAHYRADYPNEDNEHWLRNLIIRREDGQMRIETHPVALTKLALDADTKGKTGAK